MRNLSLAASLAAALVLEGCTMAYGGSNVDTREASGDGGVDDPTPGEPIDGGSPDTRRSKTDSGSVAIPSDSGLPDTSSPAEDTGTDPGAVDTGLPDTGSSLDGSSTDPLELARSTCVDGINKYRATLGLPPYARYTSGEVCADGQSKTDSASGIAHSAFGKCSESAQNECPGWPGTADGIITDCLKMMWDEGPGPFSGHGHYVNMSSKDYTAVSCGFFQTSGGDWWAVQDFR